MSFQGFSRAALAVQEFHAFFNGIIRHEPTRIVGRELELRKALLREEFEEFMEALDGDDLQHQYKEAADLAYVLYGWDAHAGGLLDRAVEAVHLSNMDKLWPCECMDTAPGDGSEPLCEQCRGTGLYAKFREDGKVLKPPTYERADLSFIPKDAPRKDEL